MIEMAQNNHPTTSATGPMANTVNVTCLFPLPNPVLKLKYTVNGGVVESKLGPWLTL